MEKIFNKSVFLLIKLTSKIFSFLPVHFMYNIYKKRVEFFLKSLSSEESIILLEGTSSLFKNHKMGQ